ncbi:MAG: DUF1501 domain-containing protein [Planctomycetes bacterium]|nr:DUF1501 domain-containing protein [Planctomycetota bacterium]
MLSILDKPGRLCDTVSRREMLTIGGLSLIGLSLPDVLRRQALAQQAGSARNGFGRARSVILLYLQGSPSHIDLWDPKPAAPSDIRGEFKPIATKVPGIFLGEVLPLLAQQTDKFALVRSVGVKPKGLRNRGAAIYMLMTGHDPTNFSPTGLAVPPSREDLPAIGAVATRYRPADAGSLGYVALCGAVKEGSVTGLAQSGGLLGGVYDPYQMYEDPTKPFGVDGFSLPVDVTLGRLRARIDLRTAAAARQNLGPADFDKYYGKALSLIESARAERAFRLDDEPPALRERYGPTRFGQSCLLARRLVEAGTRFVQVTWPARSDDEPAPGPDGSWDTHRNNFPMLREHRCPVFDRSVSALLEDLSARGLLGETLLLAIGEFGRSPKIGKPTTDNVGPGGRDHWPECYTCLIAGGGVRGGQVYGESDRDGAYPKNSPVHPYDLIATVYHALGIDLATEYRDTLNRPRRLVDQGVPVLGLF